MRIQILNPYQLSLVKQDIVGWLVVLRIYVASAVFQPYRDLEAGDNQSPARLGIEPRSTCSASEELSHSAIAAPTRYSKRLK